MRTEIRLALVLNGGVSLAVWMGGVVHELDLARRASLGLDPPPAGHLDAPVFEHWKKVCDAADVKLRVDVIAGTSAGGLNGALLAEAIANGHPIVDLKDVWLTAGSLDAKTLLRVEDRASVLSGCFFEEKINDQLTGMASATSEDRTGESVTLFVTSTGLSGGNREIRDAFGSDFTEQDHRRLYRFARQDGELLFADGAITPQEREDRFTPEDRVALTRAIRASAGFPAAFAPVDEKPLLEYRVSPPKESGTSGLIDGGVLDNAPFGPVLAEVGRRPVDGPYRRVVGYIVPSSGPLRDTAAGLPYPETPLTHVLGATVQMPREADFRDDVEELTTLNRDNAVDAQSRLIRTQLRDSGAAGRMTEAAERLLTEYAYSSLAAAVLDLRTLLRTQGRTVLAHADVTLPSSVAIPAWLPTSLATWHWTPESAQRALSPLLRGIQDRLLSLQDPLVASPLPAAVADDLSVAQTAIDRALRSTRAVADAMTRTFVRSASAAELDVPVLLTLLDEAHDDLQPATALDGYVAAAVEAYARVMLPGQSDRVLAACISAEVIARTGYPGGGTAYPPFDLLRIGPDVESPLATEDAFQGLGGNKLYGTAVGHFGGFLDEGWRRWDYMWGRLDGTTQIMRLFDALPSPSPDLAEHQRLILTAEKTTEDDVVAGLVFISDAKNNVVAEKLKTREGRTIVRDVLLAVLRVLTRPLAEPHPKGWKRLAWVAASGEVSWYRPDQWALSLLMMPARHAAKGSYDKPADLPKRVIARALMTIALTVLVVGIVAGIVLRQYAF